MKGMFKIFPDVHVKNDPYPIQFGSGDWITVVSRCTGTFTGEMLQPDGNVVPLTGKSFDVEFVQTPNGTAICWWKSPLSGTPSCRPSRSASLVVSSMIPAPISEVHSVLLDPEPSQYLGLGSGPVHYRERPRRPHRTGRFLLR